MAGDCTDSLSRRAILPLRFGCPGHRALRSAKIDGVIQEGRGCAPPRYITAGFGCDWQAADVRGTMARRLKTVQRCLDFNVVFLLETAAHAEWHFRLA
jgi:hypothetical protein